MWAELRSSCELKRQTRAGAGLSPPVDPRISKSKCQMIVKRLFVPSFCSHYVLQAVDREGKPAPSRVCRHHPTDLSYLHKPTGQALATAMT